MSYCPPAVRPETPYNGRAAGSICKLVLVELCFPLNFCQCSCPAVRTSKRQAYHLRSLLLYKPHKVAKLRQPRAARMSSPFEVG